MNRKKKLQYRWIKEKKNKWGISLSIIRSSSVLLIGKVKTVSTQRKCITEKTKKNKAHHQAHVANWIGHKSLSLANWFVYKRKQRRNSHRKNNNNNNTKQNETKKEVTDTKHGKKIQINRKIESTLILWLRFYNGIGLVSSAQILFLPAKSTYLLNQFGWLRFKWNWEVNFRVQWERVFDIDEKKYKKKNNSKRVNEMTVSNYINLIHILTVILACACVSAIEPHLSASEKKGIWFVHQNRTRTKNGVCPRENVWFVFDTNPNHTHTNL